MRHMKMKRNGDSKHMTWAKKELNLRKTENEKIKTRNRYDVRLLERNMHYGRMKKSIMIKT